MSSTFSASPSWARVDASAACQLDCPLCPVTTGENNEVVGRGNLRPEDFLGFLERNPQLRHVELANSGEAVLNKRLPEILSSAHERGVTTYLDTGVNLNYLSDETAEALVKYGTAVVRVAIDGITRETYARYRIGGELGRVLTNVQRINEWKARYRSIWPHLILQFVIFGHNAHEIERARLLARMLRMKCRFKLNWNTEPLPLDVREHVRGLLGYADRAEYFAIRGKLYCQEQCAHLWLSPQINWDGKLLGCARNRSMAYVSNAFGWTMKNLLECEPMRYARAMVMGEAPPRDDIACSQCAVYEKMAAMGAWITADYLASVTVGGDGCGSESLISSYLPVHHTCPTCG
ncbi:Radical SAM protein [Gammaproteobacteria bacterium]